LSEKIGGLGAAQRRRLISKSQFEKLNKHWKKTYIHQQLVDEKLFWDNKCIMCPRWHVKGDYFDNYTPMLHTASHVSKRRTQVAK